jgi:hypothetical protein
MVDEFTLVLNRNKLIWCSEFVQNTHYAYPPAFTDVSTEHKRVKFHLFVAGYQRSL